MDPYSIWIGSEVISLELSDKESLFLDTLEGCTGKHTSDKNLRKKLYKKGIEEDEYNEIKRNLIFKGYIGTVYGNVTLEKRKSEE